MRVCVHASFASGLVHPCARVIARANEGTLRHGNRVQVDVGAALALAGLIGDGCRTAQDNVQVLPTPSMSGASRLGAGITGASTTVITAEDIARSPGTTIAGRAVARAGHSDLQHCSAASTAPAPRSTCAASAPTAASNTLVLINGRRLNDIDLAGVDFSAIPRDSIERIEITRGNSGAVLYGDGAVGGVINIVTKTGVGAAAVRARRGGLRLVQPARGQRLGQRVARARSRFRFTPTRSIPTAIASTTRAPAQRRRRLPLHRRSGSAYLNISADDQQLGLPGARLVDADLERARHRPARRDDAERLLPTSRASTLTLGYRAMLGQGVELIVDGGVRRKDQQAFSSLFGFDTSDVARTDHGLADAARQYRTAQLFGAAHAR